MHAPFILLTAAKNEGEYIATTVESVLRQTVQPTAWFIMDDGSTDETAEIVARYSERHSFIHLYSTGADVGRSFGSKSRAINAAFERALGLAFEYVGILDADIAPRDNDYYERILDVMRCDDRLGIAGGYVHEQSRPDVWTGRKANSRDSVAGGVQMFRRACYEQVGGFAQLALGGEDWLVQLDAGMRGWHVRAIPELPVHHFRPTSSAGGRWRGLFRLGQLDASFGSHPIFEVIKCVRRIGERPVVLSSLIRFAGFWWWRAARRSPSLSADRVSFLRAQQVLKLRGAINWRRRSPINH